MVDNVGDVFHVFFNSNTDFAFLGIAEAYTG